MKGLFTTIKMYRKWWKTWGTLPVTPWIKAASLYRSGNFADAAKKYRDGLARFAHHPARFCARLDLAYCLFRTGDLKGAEAELRFAAAHAPESREAHLRLGQFLVWVGRPLEAAWVLRRAIKFVAPDAELAATLLSAAIDGCGPRYLVKDALEAVRQAEQSQNVTERGEKKLRVARAKLLLSKGDYDRARTQLARLSCDGYTCLDAVLAFSEILIREGKVSFARQQLRRGLSAAPHHPRVLSLLAESYLKPGQFFNADYAAQLATNACQCSDWSSPREMHILAEAHLLRGDKIAALLMASKAKEAGSRLLGAYPQASSLNALIQDLSTGTLA